MKKDQWQRSHNGLLGQELLTACVLESIAVFNNTDLKKRKKRKKKPPCPLELAFYL